MSTSGEGWQVTEQSSAAASRSAQGEQGEQTNQFSLLKQRRFAPFFTAQFFGAANDNVFKSVVTLLITYQTTRYTTLDTSLAVNLIAAVFILPFLLFSATSGQLADKFDKARLMQLVKLFEVGIVLVGAAALYFHHFGGLLSTVFLLGLHSTLFGPVKYAYLPQVLKPHEIVGGNGLVESGTFIAILLGTLFAGVLLARSEVGHLHAAALCLLFALIGLAASWAIPRAAASEPLLVMQWNPWRVTVDTLRLARGDRAVFLSLLGISWLWFFGAVFLTNLPQFAHLILGGGPSVATLLIAIFSIGIGLGSLLCERLSHRQVEIGLVPLGSLGMTVFAVDLYFAVQHLPPAPADLWTAGGFIAQSAHWRLLVDLLLLAMFSGLYSVPLYALIQTRAVATHKARIIAANNILNSLFLILSAAFAAVVLSVLHLSIGQLLLLTGLLNLIVALYIYLLLPEFLLRLLSWLLVSVMYRVRAVGSEFIPSSGAAVIVSNHVSFVDALILMATSPRPIRFVMDLSIFRIPVLSWLFRQCKAIPIASAKQDPAMMERAFERVSEELRDGQLVCIFPEGRITDHGELYPFRPGITRILQKDPVPVVPVALQGLWGSFFSRKGGAAMTKPLRRGVWSRVGIHVGAPIAASEATPEQLQRRVQELRGGWQ